MSGSPQRRRARVFGSRPEVVQRSPGGISCCQKMSRGSPRVALRPIGCLVVFSMFFGSCDNVMPCILFVIQSRIWLLALYSFPLDGCQHLVKRVAQMTPRQRRVAVDSDVLQKYVFSLLFCIKVFSAFLLLPFLYLHNFHNFQTLCFFIRFLPTHLPVFPRFICLFVSCLSS